MVSLMLTPRFLIIQVVFLLTWMQACPLLAESKSSEKPFTATVMDNQGIETEVRNLQFYWEEKVSETAFVPHVQKHVTVKRGAATINVKFEHIRSIDFAPGQDGTGPQLTITLVNGKSGDFPLAVAGSFKGESDFGEIDVPASSLKKLEFK